MFRNLTLTILILIAVPFMVSAQSFKIVPLGVKGGIDESNLSAYMVAPAGSSNYLCLDAGTLHAGIEKAISNHVFTIPAEQVLRRYIKAYFISHAHLDHIAGLIINSPDDTVKNIYALESTIKTIKTDYFTWESWANFTDEGEAPLIKKYHYQILTPGSTISIKNTGMQVTAYPLSHSNLTSTAFLVNSNGAYLLYLGDTGADSVEHSIQLHSLWQAIAPLLKSRQLKGIFIETSFPDEQPTAKLFGHLNPGLFFLEMNDLASLCGAEVLKGFPVLITHIKPVNSHTVEQVHMELVKGNSLKLRLIFPGQAIPLIF